MYIIVYLEDSDRQTYMTSISPVASSSGRITGLDALFLPAAFGFFGLRTRSTARPLLFAFGDAEEAVGEAGRDSTGRGGSGDGSRLAGVDAGGSSRLGTSMDSEEKKVLRGMGIVCVRMLPLVSTTRIDIE